jgi:DNA polymerase I
MTDENRIYLVDGSAYIHRAYHAIRSLSTSRGFATNAVYGFTRMLIKLIHDKNPKYAAMVFDSAKPTFRHELYPEYKANRARMPEDLAAQVPYIKKITEAFNLPVIEKGGFEADDLIGALARKAEEAGFDVVMVTGDKDFVQLLTDRIIIWDPMKDVIIDKKRFFKDKGIAPAQMVDVQGLSGDSSDNIPGVPGIGPKTAEKLVLTYHSMDELYERIDEIKAGKQKDRLLEYRDQAFLSRQLATIDTNAPVDLNLCALQMAPPDNARLGLLFKELEFSALQKEFPVKADLSGKKYSTVLDRDSLRMLVDTLRNAGRFAVDTETTSISAIAADLVGLSFSIEPGAAFYVPCGHRGEAVKQLELSIVKDELKALLEDANVEKIGQNIKYDMMVLGRHGIELSGVVFDTMIASYLLNPDKRSHSLEQIALDLLDHPMISYADVTMVDGRKVDSFADVPIDDAAVYACEDADVTLEAAAILAPKIKEAGLAPLMETVEMPLVPVLARMERTGIRVDTDRLGAMSKELAEELDAIKGQIYALAGEEFNINSSQQLGVILFEKIGLPKQKKTKKKTAYSTDVEVLTSLAATHELPAMILRHRTLSKLKSTYVDALVELVNPATGRVHTSFNQTVTATGRLSSSNPNLQNIPIRTEAGKDVRRAFIPGEGRRFLSADYSQIELRLLAHYADDQKLIGAFLNDEDIHARTAAEVFMASPAMVTDELRRQAKTINFGIIYGMGAYSLSRELGISQKMAKTYIDNYFFKYQGVKAYMDETLERARKTGKVSTQLGRIRFLPEINSKNSNVRAFAERMAINMPIQGTAADLLKLAMIRVDREIAARKFQSAMLLTVHDEMVFEVPMAEIEEMKALVKETMEGVWELKVPLKVNVAVGDNWAEAH